MDSWILADFPVGGQAVAIMLSGRRSPGATPGGRRRPFSEDAGGHIGRKYSRRSARCDQVMHAVGIALGGRPGSRIMARLAAPCSQDTLLCIIRRTASPLPTTVRVGPVAGPRVIGIDNFAWRRGHRYGSIVIDLERRTMIDILPDRERGTVANWFRANRQIAAFAAGIRTDQTVVHAAIFEPWSSGQVEGQITRLKLVKRQMYGRANLDLLKARLMAA